MVMNVGSGENYTTYKHSRYNILTSVLSARVTEKDCNATGDKGKTLAAHHSKQMFAFTGCPGYTNCPH